MTTSRARLFLAGIAAFLGFGALGVVPHTAMGAQGTPCRTAADTVAFVVYSYKRILASTGIDTSDVAIVTDSTTCQTVINSYNAGLDSLLRIDGGYVVRADTTYALHILPTSGGPYTTEIIVVMNSAFGIILRMAGLH